MGIESGGNEQPEEVDYFTAPAYDLFPTTSESDRGGLILNAGDYDLSQLKGAKGEIIRAAFERAAGDTDSYPEYSGAIGASQEPLDHYPTPDIIQQNLDEQ